MEAENINKKTNSNPINLRSEEIHEILGVPPKWIVRWGITLIFIVITIVFLGSAFFHYPDIVTAPAIITSENPPSIIISKANGKITTIFKQDGSTVFKGDTIAMIENPAKLNDVKYLSGLLLTLDPQNAKFDTLRNAVRLESLILGDVQGQFNTFSKAYSEYKLFIKQNYHEIKIKAIESEIKQYNQYYSRLLSQKKLTQQDLDLSKKQFARDSQLYKTGVISTLDFEKSQAALLSKRQSLENARLNLANTAIDIEKLKQSVIDTKLDRESQNKKLKEELVASYNQLVSSLNVWEKTYLLIAPSKGRLTYMDVWSNLQEVKSGDRLFTINPENRGSVFAQLTLPFEGAGKVKPGQRVNIKLDGYPYLEFGMVEGVVQSVSSGSLEKGYPAIVSLPNGALTSYKEKLNFERDLTGIAEVTTEDMTLLQRLFNPIKYLIKSKGPR